MEFLYDPKKARHPEWERKETKDNKFTMRTTDGRSIEIPNFQDTLLTFDISVNQSISYYKDWIPYFVTTNNAHPRLYFCNIVNGQWEELINTGCPLTKDELPCLLFWKGLHITLDFKKQLCKPIQTRKY